MQPVLKSILNSVNFISKNISQNTIVVCTQHLLDSTYDLLESIMNLGISTNKIFVLGKYYSTSKIIESKIISKGFYYQPSSYKNVGFFNESFENDIRMLWQKVQFVLDDDKSIDSIIILDDGGSCILNIPNNLLKKYSVIGVEQTSYGINKLKQNSFTCPVVNIAYSVTKQTIESKMIADALLNKLNIFLKDKLKNYQCGIVGLGAIGVALLKKLVSLNHSVLYYDIEEYKMSLIQENATPVKDIMSLINNSDFIFGCSGYDITSNVILKSITSSKTFISCSSQDKEFLTLIRNGTANFPYKILDNTLVIQLNQNVEINILKRGFPINFDDTGESVPYNDIQLTRGLLFAGVIQALCLKKYQQLPANIMLLPLLQEFIVNEWLNYTNSDYSNFTKQIAITLDWYKNNSDGEYLPISFLEELFDN